MSGRDKIEPQWPRREGEADGFDVSRTERRSAIASLLLPEGRPAGGAQSSDIAEAAKATEVPTPLPPREESSSAARGAPQAAGTRWTQLSPAQAARHPLFGVDGWLLAIGMFLVAEIARACVEAYDFWWTTDYGGLSAWIMAGLRAAMAFWALLVLGLMAGRSSAFPANFAAYALLNVVYLALFGLAFAHLTNNVVFVGVAAWIGVTLLALLYVLASRRVNVTYRRRVRAKRVPHQSDQTETA